MSSDRRRRPGELEAEVLAALWAADEALTPAQVLDEVPGPLAYTTVMTILARLNDKGVVERTRAGRAFAYRPVVDEADLAATRMRALLEGGRDRGAVLARFVGTLTADDARVLETLLRRKARGGER